MERTYTEKQMESAARVTKRCRDSRKIKSCMVCSYYPCSHTERYDSLLAKVRKQNE